MGNFRAKLRHGWLTRLSLANQTRILPRDEQAVIHSATLAVVIGLPRSGAKNGCPFGNGFANIFAYLLQLPLFLS